MPSTINVAVIGTGWCGGIRAQTCAKNPFVQDLHIAEIKPEPLQEVADLTKPASATTDYRILLNNHSIDAVFISTTAEPTHYPIAKESLLAGAVIGNRFYAVSGDVQSSGTGVAVSTPAATAFEFTQ